MMDFLDAEEEETARLESLIYYSNDYSATGKHTFIDI